MFSAQTLRQKAQRDLEELPAGYWAQLRDSLVGLLVGEVRQHPGRQDVATQLCLAFSAVSAHIPIKEWGGAPSLVAWLQQAFAQEPPEVALACLLQMLAIIAEECGSFKPAIRPARRRDYQLELSGCTAEAIALLATCLPTAQTDAAKQQLFQAFSAWLALSNGLGLDPATLSSHPLVLASVQALNSDDEDVFEAAVDCVVELIRYSVADPEGGVQQQHMGLVQLLVTSSMVLRQKFVQAVAAAKETEALDEDGMAKGMARLFTEVGEAYVQVIATGDAGVLEPVQALLDVAAHPDDAICQMSYNFWHSLSMVLIHGPDAGEGEDEDEGPGARHKPLPPEEMERRRALFEPAFVQLVTLIMGRVKYPADRADSYPTWSKTEKKDFKRARYVPKCRGRGGGGASPGTDSLRSLRRLCSPPLPSRYAVADTLLDAGKVIGGDRMLQLLSQPLQALSSATASGQPFDWIVAEAAFYCMRSISKSIPHRPNELLNQVGLCRRGRGPATPLQSAAG